MKRVIPNLHVGDIVKAQVVEQLSNGYLLLDFYGDLIRVKSEIRSDANPGTSIRLQVIGLNPMQFQLYRGPQGTRLDRFA